MVKCGGCIARVVQIEKKIRRGKIGEHPVIKQMDGLVLQPGGNRSEDYRIRVQDQVRAGTK